MQLLPNVLAAGSLVAGLSKGLGVIMLVAFLFAVVKIIGGAANYNRDPDSAKASIISGVLIAGAVAIATGLFIAFGIDVTQITPDISGF